MDGLLLGTTIGESIIAIMLQWLYNYCSTIAIVS